MIDSEQELASRLIDYDTAVVAAVRALKSLRDRHGPGEVRDALNDVVEIVRPLWSMHMELEGRRTAGGTIVTQAEEQALLELRRSDGT